MPRSELWGVVNTLMEMTHDKGIPLESRATLIAQAAIVVDVLVTQERKDIGLDD
jgi:hypothetical protein